MTDKHAYDAGNWWYNDRHCIRCDDIYIRVTLHGVQLQRFALHRNAVTRTQIAHGALTPPNANIQPMAPTQSKT